MAKFGESSDLVKCSFCGKSQKQVGKLIAGPGVYICNECIGLCNDIIEEEGIVIQTGDFIASPEDDPFSEEDARVFEARGLLTGRLGRRPTVAELAAELGLDEDNITEILRRASPRPPEKDVQAWGPDEADLTPIPVALRTIQHQLSELAQRLAELVQRVERQGDP
jgi:hypothetical protein